MVRHIVWWTLKEEVGGRPMDVVMERIQEWSTTLHGMPSIKYIELSQKVQPSSTVPAQVVLTTVHENMDELASYQADPVHVEFATKMKEFAETRNVIDYVFLSSVQGGNK